LLKAEALMNSYRLTARQKNILENWVIGAFQSAADANRQPLDAGATLDRATLERCVGGGFFPGIESGTVLRQPTIWDGLARLTRGAFTDLDGSSQLMGPGALSHRMACPWQADFVECLTNWWPAQRPDIAGRTSTGGPGPDWARGIVVGGDEEAPQSHLNMIEHFAQLGVIVARDGIFVEQGRDPAFDTGV
jgi:hypothetical protein